MPLLSDAEQLIAARAQVEIYVPISAQPSIDDQIDAIMTSVKQASTWAIATAYVVGDVIMPTVRNGHRYVCIVAGTSEALLVDQPEWPLSTGGQITEGASDPILTWAEYGPEYSSIYNVREAIHLCWQAKAGRAASLFSTSQSGIKFEQQQVHEHCIKMSERYAPLEVA